MNEKNSSQEVNRKVVEEKKFENKKFNNKVKWSLLNRKQKLKSKSRLFAILPIGFFTISFLVMVFSNEQEDFSDVVIPESARTKIKE